MKNRFRHSERLYQRFAEIAGVSLPPSRAQLNRIRFNIWRVIDELRADGESPERTVVFIKKLAASAGLSEGHDAIVAQILPWCTEYYFGTTIHWRRRDQLDWLRYSAGD
jgi:hypothetical protein